MIAPPILAAATTRVAAADETLTLVSGEATASVSVRKGWSVHPALGDASRVTLGSPDGVMSVRLAVTPAVDAVATARRLAPGPLGSQVREPDGDGRRLVHAASGLAVVGFLDGGGVAVVFVSTPSPQYDAELARLLDGIEVSQ